MSYTCILCKNHPDRKGNGDTPLGMLNIVFAFAYNVNHISQNVYVVSTKCKNHNPHNF